MSPYLHICMCKNHSGLKWVSFSDPEVDQCGQNYSMYPAARMYMYVAELCGLPHAAGIGCPHFPWTWEGLDVPAANTRDSSMPAIATRCMDMLSRLLSGRLLVCRCRGLVHLCRGCHQPRVQCLYSL